MMNLSPEAYALLDAWLFGLCLIGLAVLAVVVVREIWRGE